MKYNYNEFINKRFGKIKIIEIYDKKVNNQNIKFAKCLCDCGNLIEKRFYDVKDGKITSCRKCDSILLLGKHFGELTVIDTFYRENTKNKNDLWCNCRCSCGKSVDVRTRSLTRKESPQISCGCIKVSKGQKIIGNWLESHHISFTKEETFNKADGLKTDKCNYLRFDIFIPSKNLIIEFDGIQHFYPIEMWGGENALLKTQEHDLIKNNWANENNIDIIRFNYKQTKQQIENILNSLLL